MPRPLKLTTLWAASTIAAYGVGCGIGLVFHYFNVRSIHRDERERDIRGYA